MSAITAKASRKMKKYAVLTREPRCFLGSFDFSWEQRKLGDIGKARSGVGFPDADQGGVTGVPFFKVSDMNLDGNENEMIVANNYVTAEQIADHRWSPITELPAIFFAKVGAAVMLNRKRLCRFPFLLDNNTMAYSLSPTKWDADFAKALFGTVDLTSLVQVGALPSYNAGDVESMGIYLPSLFEQEQIGAFFKLLDNLITLHQRKCALLFSPFQALISMMFTTSTFSWEQRKLGEIGSVSMCRRIFKEQTSETGDIPFYKIGTFGAEPDAFISRELFEEYKSKYPYPKKGDILISASGSIGRTVEFAGNNEYFQDSNIVWLSHDERLSNSFLKCFYSVVKWAGIEGSTIKRLYNDNILNTVICMPSVPEQEHIGLFFENLDNLITLHQRKYDKLTNVKKSMLEKMFPQNGSNAPEIRFKGFTEAWEQRKFSDLVQIERGGSPRPIDDFITDSPDGLNWVKIGDAPAQGNYITKTAEKIKPEGLSKTREVHPGDLILSNSMSFGKPYIMGIDGCIHDGWLLIRNTYKAFDLTFLCHLLGTPQMIIQYKSLAAGSTVNNLNKELVGNTVVTIPTIKEQRVLGQYLETLDNLITLHQRKPVVVNSSSTMNALPNQHLYFQVLE